jgi:hypothetical protein
MKHPVVLLSALLAAVFAAGCGLGPSIAANYPGGLAVEPTSMTPFADSSSGIKLALPPGWKSQPLTTTASKLKALFKKEGTSASLQVICGGAFDNHSVLQINMLNLITNATKVNARLWPEQSMGGGNFDSQFSAWTGTTLAGEEHNYYISWMMAFSGCKYSTFLDVKRSEASQVEGDFLAIVRSLGK